MEKIVYDIWLSLLLTPDTETFAKLSLRFSSAEEIYFASAEELSSVLKSSSEADKLLDKNLERAKAICSFCMSKGVGILTYWDERFPQKLREIPTPPVLLYYRGKLPDFSRSFAISVVGTRWLSAYGRKNAFEISSDLARAGAVVVSGMARGIDGVATAGALFSGGKTVAVLGSGIDVCYPIEHKTLAREIVKTGCVFTEYAPGTKPHKYNFPRRNRIISGLCAATLVIEGCEISGSLFTARHSKNQGRPVYALPANVGSKNSEAPTLLLKNGARVCTCADDIIRDFEAEYAGILNPFNLKGRVSMTDMNETLSKYKVSAVSVEDTIFNPPRQKRNSKEQPAKEAVPSEGLASVTEATPIFKEKRKECVPVGFDERTLKIYKKIPGGDSCLIESLVDDENSLRDVMKALLKLEMGRFIKMLPGERVARNL